MVPSRGVAEVGRNVVIKLIVVEEDSCDDVHIKQLGPNRTVIVIEPEIQERQINGAEDFIRERSPEVVIAKIQLVKEFDLGDELWDSGEEEV